MPFSKSTKASIFLIVQYLLLQYICNDIYYYVILTTKSVHKLHTVTIKCSRTYILSQYFVRTHCGNLDAVHTEYTFLPKNIKSLDIIWIISSFGLPTMCPQIIFFCLAYYCQLLAAFVSK